MQEIRYHELLSNYQVNALKFRDQCQGSPSCFSSGCPQAWASPSLSSPSLCGWSWHKPAASWWCSAPWKCSWNDKKDEERFISLSKLHSFDTLCSKVSDTSKTFIVPKVFILGNLDWFHLEAYNLPFIHAKFHNTRSSSSASTKFWKFMKFPGILLKNCIVKLFYINEPL